MKTSRREFIVSAARTGAAATIARAGHPAQGPNRPYPDENAPGIDRPNVPRRDDNHRKKIFAYF